MWIRNFRKQKTQMIIIAIVIMLATTLINGAASIMLNLETPMRKLVEECGSPEGVLFINSKDNQEIQQIKEEFCSLDGVQDADVIFYHPISEPMRTKGEEMTALLKISGYNPILFDHVRCIEGSMDIRSYGETQCAIPACISNAKDLHVKDTITIDLANEQKTYEIAGIYADPYNLSIAFSSDMIVKTLPENLETKTVMYIHTENGYTIKEVETAYRKAHDGKLNGAIYSLEGRVDDQLLAIKIMAGIFLGIGIMALLVSILVIYFITKNTVMSDTKKIAVYKTIGYSYFDVLRMYLQFYAATVALGGFIGIFTSQIFMGLILNSVYRDLGEKASFHLLYPGIFSLLAILFFVLGCIYFVLRRMKDIKPVLALKDLTNSNTKKKKYYGNLGMFSPLGIALRELWRDKRGAMGMLITGIATVILVNVAIVSLDVANHMENRNDYWLGIPSSDIIVNFSNPEQFEPCMEVLADEQSVERSIPWFLEREIMLPWKEDAEYTVMFAGIYESFEHTGLTMLEGRNPQNENEIALGERMLSALDLKIGDYITVSLDGIHEISLLITGSFQGYYDMGMYCRMLKSVYETRDVSFQYDRISVYLTEGADREQIISELQKKMDTGVEVLKREDSCKSIMEMVSNPQKQAIPPLSALILMIGGVSIFSIILLRNKKNQKKNQIYKSIGYTTCDLVISNCIYAAILGLSSIAVGVPILLLTYEKIMTICFSMFGFREYRVDFPPMFMLVINILTLLCFVLCTLLSSFGLRKVHVRDLVIE